jgi:hypothetical protein
MGQPTAIMDIAADTTVTARVFASAGTAMRGAGTIAIIVTGAS